VPTAAVFAAIVVVLDYYFAAVAGAWQRGWHREEYRLSQPAFLFGL